MWWPVFILWLSIIKWRITCSLILGFIYFCFTYNAVLTGAAAENTKNLRFTRQHFYC